MSVATSSPSRLPRLRDAHGRPLALGELLGSGGEATVYALAGGTRAVKVYHRPDAERAAKLRVMVRHPPPQPDDPRPNDSRPNDPGRHVAIAWPEQLVHNEVGAVVGFVMPRVSATRSLPLHQLYHPGSRRRRAPGIGWRYLVRIARNLCAITAALHRAGYVIGDLNERNILVSDRALVSLVDLDSIQVRDGRTTYRCLVGSAAYTPPELLGRNFRDVDRRPQHDLYALAVLIFQLLMEGVHPFVGAYHGAGEAPTLEENVTARRSPYLHGALERWWRPPDSRLLRPAAAAPPIALLPQSLRRLARRALLGPPRGRPDATRWQRALERLEADLVSCDEVMTHAYGRHLHSCPWCARRERLGREPYPPLPGARPSPHPASGPAPGLSPGRRRTAPAWRLAGKLPALTTLLLLVALVGSALVAAQLWRLGLLWGWGPAVRTAAAAAALVLLPAALLAGGLAKARTSARTSARSSRRRLVRLRQADRLARAGLGAGLLALLGSVMLGLTTGVGSVLAGDWLLLPSLWVLGFYLLWRRLS